MQTEIHAGTRSAWPEWAAFLHRRGLGSLASWALEAFGPLVLIGVQVFHMGSPLLRPALPSARIETLLSLLEDPAETRAFADFLREGCST